MVNAGATRWAELQANWFVWGASLGRLCGAGAAIEHVRHGVAPLGLRLRPPPVISLPHTPAESETISGPPSHIPIINNTSRPFAPPPRPSSERVIHFGAPIRGSSTHFISLIQQQKKTFLKCKAVLRCLRA